MVIAFNLFEGGGYLSFHKLSLVSKKALVVNRSFFVFYIPTLIKTLS